MQCSPRVPEFDWLFNLVPVVSILRSLFLDKYLCKESAMSWPSNAGVAETCERIQLSFENVHAPDMRLHSSTEKTAESRIGDVIDIAASCLSLSPGCRAV